MMHVPKTFVDWLYGLLYVAIGGAAQGGLLVLAVPDKFTWTDLSALGRAVFALTLVNIFLYLKQRPLPKRDGFIAPTAPQGELPCK